MNQKDIKKRANIGIRRKGEMGFKKTIKTPGSHDERRPGTILPIPAESDEKRPFINPP